MYDSMGQCENSNANCIAKYAKYSVHGSLGRNIVIVYNRGYQCGYCKGEYVMFMAVNSDVSATAHQIVEL